MSTKCIICGEPIQEYNYLIIKGGKCICNPCKNYMDNLISSTKELEKIDFNMINACDNKVDEKLFEKPMAKTTIIGKKPKEIKAYLDERVIGQEKAKKILAVASYNHYKRAAINDPSIKKSNVLLVGPTGSGKTYLVQSLSKALDVPLAIVSATKYTEAGYIGEDVESMLLELLAMADGDIEKAERGIIFIDEIDKLNKKSSETKSAVGGVGVQQALLTMLEGSKVTVTSPSTTAGVAKKVTIDTSNILFICGGAFPDAEEIIKKRMNTGDTSIGFAANIEKKKIDDTNILLNVTKDDLIEFGLIPELLGRLPVVAPLENLTVETLKRILVEPKDSIVSEYVKLLEHDEVKLVFEDDALTAIAEKAIKIPCGARALREVTEELLLDIQYEVPSDMEVGEIRITREYVENKEEATYIRRGGMSTNSY